jgi:hypothetical protein
MSLNTRIDLNIGATLLDSLDLSSESKVALSIAKAIVLANGTDDGECDVMWFDSRTIPISTNDDLDLDNLMLGDRPISFAKIKIMHIYSLPANVNTIVVGGSASPFVGWVAAGGDAINVQPGGMQFLVAPNAGYPVTPVTGNVLRLANGSGSAVDYEIALFGTSV